MEGVWSAENTTPGAIDSALRKLLAERHADDDYAPARVLNLIAVVDQEWRGEIENRLEKVGRFHPSRTIICALEPKRDTLDAWATMSASATDGAVGAEERVELAIGEKHVPNLETIVDPLLVPDLATLLWSPHGHPEAIDALIELTDTVLIDSVQEPEPKAAVERAHELLEDAYVVDLAWLRSAPWRERIAATFDPPAWRHMLREISAVTVRHHPDSITSGSLILGWLASRLGWEPSAFDDEDGGLVARAKAVGRRVKMRLEVDETMPVPGLSGLTVETAEGLQLSLDRGEGGLTARRKQRGGREICWRVLGASRGESGILGEGIRQALLRDPTYGPALTAASAMLSR